MVVCSFSSFSGSIKYQKVTHLTTLFEYFKILFYIFALFLEVWRYFFLITYSLQIKYVDLICLQTCFKLFMFSNQFNKQQQQQRFLNACWIEFEHQKHVHCLFDYVQICFPWTTHCYNENSVTFHYKVLKMKLCRNASDISNLLFNGMKQNHLINMFHHDTTWRAMWWVGTHFSIFSLFSSHSDQ